MNMNQMSYARPVAQAEDQVRANFIKKTYLHVALAILGFILIEFVLFKTGLAEVITNFMLGVSWLLVLGLFMVVSYVADRIARKPSASKAAQYTGLILYTIAQAIIFVPMLFIAIDVIGDSSIVQNAAILTLVMFAALTAVAFFSGVDFSFLRGALMIGGMLAVGAIVLGVLFGFSLGLWFSLAMVVFASGAILYDTSNIIHHYHEDQYVAASISLFASVALLFWYILQIFLSRD